MEVLNLAFDDGLLKLVNNGLLNLVDYWVMIFLVWVRWWVMVCGWFEGLWVARFCVLWFGGGGIDLVVAMAGCGSEAWMGCWVFSGGLFRLHHHKSSFSGGDGHILWWWLIGNGVCFAWWFDW